MNFKPILIGAFCLLGLVTDIKFFVQTDEGAKQDSSAHETQLADTCLSSFSNEDLVTVNLGIAPEILTARSQSQVTLTIPEAYIPPKNRPRFKSGQLDGAAMLYAKLPDFGTYPSNAMGNPQADGADTQVRILINTYVELASILDSSIDVWGRTGKPAAEVPKIPFDYALNKADYKLYGGQGQEVFYHQADGQITDVLICSVGYPYNTCSHNFDAGEVELKLTYSKSNLPDWQAIKSTAQSFTDCLGANSNS